MKHEGPCSALGLKHPRLRAVDGAAHAQMKKLDNMEVPSPSPRLLDPEVLSSSTEDVLDMG